MLTVCHGASCSWGDRELLALVIQQKRHRTGNDLDPLLLLETPQAPPHY